MSVILSNTSDISVSPSVHLTIALTCSHFIYRSNYSLLYPFTYSLNTDSPVHWFLRLSFSHLFTHSSTDVSLIHSCRAPINLFIYLFMYSFARPWSHSSVNSQSCTMPSLPRPSSRLLVQPTLTLTFFSPLLFPSFPGDAY